MRRHADRLADLGHLVLAPDPMARGRRGVVPARTMTARRGSGPAFDDIEAALGPPSRQTLCTGAIGVIGFCMGVVRAAPAGRPGGMPPWSTTVRCRPTPAALDGACPVVASLRRSRPLPVGGRARLEAAPAERGVVHDVKEYPEAGHAWLNDEDTAPSVPSP